MHVEKGSLARWEGGETLEEQGVFGASAEWIKRVKGRVTEGRDDVGVNGYCTWSARARWDDLEEGDEVIGGPDEFCGAPCDEHGCVPGRSLCGWFGLDKVPYYEEARCYLGRGDGHWGTGEVQVGVEGLEGGEGLDEKCGETNGTRSIGGACATA